MAVDTTAYSISTMGGAPLGAAWSACLERWQPQQAVVVTGWCHRACDQRQHALHGHAV